MTNDNFKDSIDYYFSDVDIENKKFLEIIMRKRGFFNAKDDEQREIQTQQLLDSAWDYLKGYEQKQKQQGILGHEYRDFYIVDVGFKRKQLRDKKTGRIRGWI